MDTDQLPPSSAPEPQQAAPPDDAPPAEGETPFDPVVPDNTDQSEK